MTRKVAIYIRVSTIDQAKEGYSLEAQEKALKNGALIENTKSSICMQIGGYQGKTSNIDQK